MKILLYPYITANAGFWTGFHLKSFSDHQHDITATFYDEHGTVCKQIAYTLAPHGTRLIAPDAIRFTPPAVSARFLCHDDTYITSFMGNNDGGFTCLQPIQVSDLKN